MADRSFVLMLLLTGCRRQIKPRPWRRRPRLLRSAGQVKLGLGPTPNSYVLGARPFEPLDMSNDRWAFTTTWLLLCAFSSEILAASNPVTRSSVPYIIDVKETEDGLPQNSVIAITQTRDG